MKRKRFSRLLFLMLTIMITVTFYQPAQAASGKYTGTYSKTWSMRLLPLQRSVKETQFLLSGKIHGAIPALEH